MILNIFLSLFLFSGLLGDIITTFICLSVGMAEANPIANLLISSYLFVPIKIAIFIAFLILLFKSLRYVRQTRNLVVGITLLIIVVNFLAIISNTIGLIQVARLRA